MLTAKDGDLDEAEALDTGADDYSRSPSAGPCWWRGCMRCCVGRRSREPAPAAAGDLRIDPAERGRGAARTRCELTAREFDVLEFLIRRSGQVFTKYEILDGVWDHDFEGDPNVVEVYVRRLRRKIDEPYARHAIETIRGAGYRMAADGG